MGYVFSYMHVSGGGSNVRRHATHHTKLALALVAFAVVLGYGAGARADILAYDDFDGHSGGTVGWQSNWFYPTSCGALAEPAGVGRRYPAQRWTFSNDGTIRGLGGKCLTVHGVNTAVTVVSSIPDWSFN